MRAARVGDLASIFKKDAESRQKPYKVAEKKDSKHDKKEKKSKKKVKRPKFNNAFDDKADGLGGELPDMNADPKRRQHHKKSKRNDVLDINSEAQQELSYMDNSALYDQSYKKMMEMNRSSISHSKKSSQEGGYV